MGYETYPINPDLTEDGAFSCFSHLPNGELLKPRHLKINQEEFADYDAKFYKTTLSVGAHLGFSGIVDADSSVNSTIMIFDMYRFSRGLEDPRRDNGVYITETLWGCGFRISINMLSVEGSLNAGYMGVAAACQHGQASASYSIDTFGLSDPSLAKLFPPPGPFDMTVASSLMELGDKLKNGHLTEPDKRISVPFQIRANQTLFQPRLGYTKSTAFAVRSIKHRKTLGWALDQISNHDGISPITLITTYKTWGIDSDTAKPSKSDSERAESWLNE